MKKYMIGTYAESGEFFPLTEYLGGGAVWYVNAPDSEDLETTINRFYNTIDSEYIEDDMTVKEIEIAPEEADCYICANPDEF